MHQEIKDSLPGDNRSSERFLYTINRTFNLPDARAGTLWGANSTSSPGWTLGTKYTAGLPNIIGEFRLGGNYGFDGFDYASGGFYLGTVHNTYQADTVKRTELDKMGNIIFQASHSNSIYGSSTTVRPANICIWFIIKYI